MTTTPEEPRPDDGHAPIEAEATAETAAPADSATAAAAGPTTPSEGDTTEGDTIPLELGDTAPLPATPSAPTAAAPEPGTPAAPADAGYHPPYAGQPASDRPAQPYAGPPAQPYAAPAGQPYAAPAGQPYSAPAGQPYAGPPAQPYAGQPYAGQPYGGQAGQPYGAHPAQPPYPAPQHGYGPRPIAAGQQPYAAPSYPAAPHAAHQPYGAAPVGAVPPAQGPGGTAPGAPRRRRSWVPVVATLVVVVLLAAAAIAIGTHRWRADGLAAGSSHPASIATIGQGGSGTVPVAGSTAENPNWAAVAAAVQGAVVAIDVQTTSGEALGSGFVVDTKGHVVTNNHVVEGIQGSTLQVTLSDGRIYDATVAGTDASTDLAVVTIKNPPSDLTVVQFGNSDKVGVGDPVMAVGNPLGLANTVTTGIVSAVDRPVSPQSENGGTAPVTNALQIDAAINPGNSGGPLFNAQGQVIGITSSIATTSSSSGSIGLGFAIPVNLVQNIAQQLIDRGTAEHAYLGVSLKNGTATADGVTRHGAQVMEVSNGSPAGAAGVKVGDVVVSINGKPVASSDSLAAYVRAMASGDKATLVLVRDGKSLSVDVTLATRPDSTGQGAPSQGSSNPSPTSPGQGNQNGGAGNGNSLPGNLQNMTPDELWQWLQQHQGQGSTPGSTPGSQG